MASHIETPGRTLNDLVMSAVVWFKISTKEKVLSLQLILDTDRDGFLNQMLLPLPKPGSVQEATGEKASPSCAIYPSKFDEVSISNKITGLNKVTHLVRPFASVILLRIHQ